MNKFSFSFKAVCVTLTLSDGFKLTSELRLLLVLLALELLPLLSLVLQHRLLLLLQPLQGLAPRPLLVQDPGLQRNIGEYHATLRDRGPIKWASSPNQAQYVLTSMP